jgi:drug/metabolite transporter (DMT)-like permease
MHGIHPVQAFAAISQYTAAAMVVLMLLAARRCGAEVLALPGGQIALLLLSAVIGIALGHVFYYTAIARLGVAVSAGVLQLQPFIVAVASLLLFGEKLTAAQWIGGCTAVSGAVMMLAVQRALTRPARPVEPAQALAESESGA